MYDHETKNRFVDLRAQGLSLDAISSQLDVPRATLGRWHHESVEQIQRLRALQWHLLEENIGHRLEDSLQRIAQRIRKWEDELDERDPGLRKTVELARIIRDSRREYLQLRSILLAPLQPTRSRAACPTGLDPQKRDKTRQNQNSLTATALPTNDLQQSEPATSHSDCPALVADEVTSQLTSPDTFDNPAPTSVNAASDSGTATHPPGANDPVTPDLRAQPRCETESNSRGLTPQRTLDNQAASSASAASDSIMSTPPKKHKPYWLNGHYYENPEYPEHIARAMFAGPRS